MKLNEFLKIHHESGYSIRSIDGYNFLSRGLINYSFPQLGEIPITNRLVQLLKWRYLITIIKTNSGLKNNYEYIMSTESYDIDDFRKKTRTTIRKSLNSCEFRKPSLEELLNEGLQINRKTLKIQKRSDKFLTNPVLWENYISQFYHHNDSMVMGAFFNGKMIGYAIAYELEGKHYFHLQHIDRDFATYYPMSGLMYVIVNKLISKSGKIEISDGIESFNPMPSLNQFKTYMRFVRVPITRVYVIHPLLIAVFKPLIYFYVSVLGKRTVHNQWLRQIVTLYQGYRKIPEVISRQIDAALPEEQLLTQKVSQNVIV